MALNLSLNGLAGQGVRQSPTCLFVKAKIGQVCILQTQRISARLAPCVGKFNRRILSLKEKGCHGSSRDSQRIPLPRICTPARKHRTSGGCNSVASLPDCPPSVKQGFCQKERIIMNPARIHSVLLKKISPEKLHGKRLCTVPGQSEGGGLRVEPSPLSNGQHILWLFWFRYVLNPSAPSDLADWQKVSLDQDTVDRIEDVKDDSLERSRGYDFVLSQEVK